VEFLLLLSAILASLTGISAGDRGVRAVPGVSVVQAAESAAAVAQPARATRIAVALPTVRQQVRSAFPVIIAAPIAALRLAFDQRRE
jgi:hypothetical protein